MSIQLHLITVEDEDVPILWDPANGDLPSAFEGQTIRTMSDMEAARMSGTSNRSRTVTIVDGRDAARMLAMMEREEHSARVAVSPLSGDAWAVGSTWRDGSYDSGTPLITDAREFGDDLELDLDEALLEETSFSRLRDTHAADLVELSAENQPSLDFG